MKIFYHSADDDGRCSAAIINALINNVYGSITESDCIGYRYGENLIEKCKDLTFNENEEVYIVDLSLDDQIQHIVRKAFSDGAKVFHFDHHDSSVANMESFTGDDKALFEGMTYIYAMDISASMICFIYSCFTDEEKHDVKDVTYDLTDDRSHVLISYNGDSREYGIPIVVRYVDDNDTWRHKFNETKYFCIAFSMEENRHPLNQLWADLLFETNYKAISKYIDDGVMLFRYQEKQNRCLMRNAFESHIDGLKVLCINSCQGNSRIFGDNLHEYPAVCKFGYDGSIHKWIYTLYGSDVYDPEKKIDLSKIAASYGGGGHVHACGFQLDYNMFE